MNPFRRYDIRHIANTRGDPVTEILDRKLVTASRFLGVYTDEHAIATLKFCRLTATRPGEQP